MGYEISLRRQEAGMIEVLSEYEAKEQVTKPNFHPGMSEDIYPGEEELKLSPSVNAAPLMLH